MKERPILMSAPMVNALLEGRKTQTRRIVKQKHLPWIENSIDNFLSGKWDRRPFPHGQPGDRLWVKETFGITESQSYADGQSDEVIIYRADGWKDDTGHFKWKPSIFMPRWASRILLEVTDIRVERLQDISEEDAEAEGIYGAYIENGWYWRNYMLSDEEAECSPMLTSPIESYRSLWETINGEDLPLRDADGKVIGKRHNPARWEANPYVWAISFRRIKG